MSTEMITEFEWMTVEEYQRLTALHDTLVARRHRPMTLLDVVRWALEQAGKPFNLGRYPWPTTPVEEPPAEDADAVEEYAFEPPPTEGVTEQDLLTYTVAELRDMAYDMSIDLTGLGRKADIIDALRRALTE